MELYQFYIPRHGGITVDHAVPGLGPLLCAAEDSWCATTPCREIERYRER